MIEDIGEVKEDEDEVEITLDSGAAKSVLPRKKGREKEQDSRSEAQAVGGEWDGDDGDTSGR